MNALPITVGQSPMTSDIDSSTDGAAMQREEVKYEHSGYQIRVYFSGDKTFSQCIRNLAERRSCS